MNDIKQTMLQIFIAVITITVLLIVPFSNKQYLSGEVKFAYNTLNNTYKYSQNKILMDKVNKILSMEEYQSYRILSQFKTDNNVFVLTINSNNEMDISKTFFLDVKSGLEKNIGDIVSEISDEMIIAEFNKKYPKFISDAISQNMDSIFYIFSSSEIIVSCNSFLLDLNIKENLNISLSYENGVIIYSDNTYQLSKKKKTVAFTFDDGPSGYTAEIIDFLDEYHAKATFFMVGTNMIKKPGMVQLVLDRGNEIGSHSYEHKYMTKQSPKELSAMHSLMDSIYYEISSKNFLMTRPPYGSIDSDVTNSIDTAFIMWSLDTRDWEKRNVDAIVTNVMENIQDGDIILFHDVYSTTREAIKILLPLLYEQGYQITTVSELAKLKNLSLENGTIYHNFYTR